METLSKIMPQPQLKNQKGLNSLYKDKEYATYDFDGEGNTERLKNQEEGEIPIVDEIRDYYGLYYPAAGELGISFQHIQKVLNGLQKVKDKYKINVDKPDMTSYIYSSSTFVGSPVKTPMTGPKNINSVWALNSYLGSLYQKPLYISDRSGNTSSTLHSSLKFFKYVEDKNVTIDNAETINTNEIIKEITLSRNGTSDIINYKISQDENENITISCNIESTCLIAGWTPISENISASLSWYINSIGSLEENTWSLLLSSENINNLQSTENTITSSDIFNLIGINIPLNIDIDENTIILTPQDIPITDIDNIDNYNGKELWIKVKVIDNNNGQIRSRQQKVTIQVTDTREGINPYDSNKQEDYIFNLDYNLSMNENQLLLGTINDLDTELNKDIPCIRKAITDCHIDNYKVLNLFLYSTEQDYPIGQGKQVVYHLNPATYAANIGEVNGISSLGIVFPKDTLYGNTKDKILSRLKQIKLEFYVNNYVYKSIELDINLDTHVYKDGEDYILFKIPIDDNIGLYSDVNGTFKGQNRYTSVKISIEDNNSNIIFENTYKIMLHEIKVKLFEGLYLYNYGDSENGEYVDNRQLTYPVSRKFNTWYIDGTLTLKDPYLNTDISSYDLISTYYQRGMDYCSLVSLTDIFAINRRSDTLSKHILFTKPCYKEDFTTTENGMYIKPYNSNNNYISFQYNRTSDDIDIKYAYVRTFFDRDSKGLYSGDPYFIELKTNIVLPLLRPLTADNIDGLQIGGIKQQILLVNNYNLDSNSIWNFVYPIFIYNDSNFSVNITITDYTRTLYDNYGSKDITINPHELIYLCQNKYSHGSPARMSLFRELELSINNSSFKCLKSQLTTSQCINYINQYHHSHYPGSLSFSNEDIINSYPDIVLSGTNFIGDSISNNGTMFHIQLASQYTSNYTMILVILAINKNLVSSILEISPTINYNSYNHEIEDTSNDLWPREVWQPSNTNGLSIDTDSTYRYWYIPYFYENIDNQICESNLHDITIQDNQGRWFYYNENGNLDGTIRTDMFETWNPNFFSFETLEDAIYTDGTQTNSNNTCKFPEMDDTSNYCMLKITIDYLDDSHPQGWFDLSEFNIHSGVTLNGTDLQY